MSWLTGNDIECWPAGRYRQDFSRVIVKLDSEPGLKMVSSFKMDDDLKLELRSAIFNRIFISTNRVYWVMLP